METVASRTSVDQASRPHDGEHDTPPPSVECVGPCPESNTAGPDGADSVPTKSQATLASSAPLQAASALDVAQTSPSTAPASTSTSPGNARPANGPPSSTALANVPATAMPLAPRNAQLSLTPEQIKELVVEIK